MILKNSMLLLNKMKVRNKNCKNNMNLLFPKEIFLEHSSLEEVLKQIFYMKKLKSINLLSRKEKINIKID